MLTHPSPNRRWRWRTRVPLLLAVVLPLALAACGGALDEGGSTSPAPSAVPSPPPLQSVIVTNDLVTGGDQRVAIGIVDAGGVPVPDVSVTVQLWTLPSPGGGTPTAIGAPTAAPYKGDLLKGKGVYVVHQVFAQPGNYQARVIATKGGVTTHTVAAFQVISADTDQVPGVGAGAPKTGNATGDPAKDPSLDTGVPPDDMHYISIAGAIAAHHPFVAYFGSPGFCTSKLCGPQVDVVRSIEGKYHAKGVDFTHVETYLGGHPSDPDLTKAKINPSFDEWHLPSDPWVFVVDRNGKVAARFEGPSTADEIAAVLDHLT
jgi:hypothetical protein